MNLSRGGPQDPNKFDLMGVTSHEIDEVLGFGSGLNFGSSFPPLPQDLFRYSAPGVRSYTTSTTATSYLSIDGGTTNLTFFNQSGVGDYGDWVVHSPAQVQDWAGTPGATPNLGFNELTNLDVIGYDLKPAVSAVPEPGPLALAAAGGAFVGLLFWRRRRRTA
jgi:hypothetical protein